VSDSREPTGTRCVAASRTGVLLDAEQGTSRFRRVGRTLQVLAIVTACAAVVDGRGPDSVHADSHDPTCEPAVPETCTIADLARTLGLRFGATLEDFEIANAQYTATLGREFTSLTPENALKAYSTQPNRGVWQFAGGDAVVGFAETSGLEVRGHTLVWAKDEYTPSWMTDITDPAELRSVTEAHITEVMGRYVGRIPRWDVVNEPLDTLGTGPSESVFWSLGPEWIGNLFELAHSIDPAAELWINEYGTDWVPGKHEAYLDLVRQLVESGVPIDGVGIQTHRLPGLMLDRAVFEAQLRDFASLGLEVAITELDVPVSPTDPGALTWQAREYRKVVAACLAVAGCSEVTIWGLTDADTWLDSLGTFPTPTRPLLFDSAYQPKPAYVAVRDLMAFAVINGSLPPTGDPSDVMLALAGVMLVAGLGLRAVAARELRLPYLPPVVLESLRAERADAARRGLPD
jgi:endo-1,4-beta-xylanase